MTDTTDVSGRPGYDALWLYFGLSYAGWLTLPRALIHEMPDGWQARMAELLNEWDDTWRNPPNLDVLVTLKKGNRFVKPPEFLTNYRRPDRAAINELRGRRAAEQEQVPKEKCEHGFTRMRDCIRCSLDI